MDDAARAYYEVAFERDFIKKKADEFQDFFSTIMEKRYLGDFQRVRPWGNVGDKKNDGYLKSQRLLFQVYAPEEMTLGRFIKKIDEDFHGALPHWQDHFDQWVFVHNARNGLGPDHLKKLLDLENENAPLIVTNWGFEELKQQLFALTDTDIALVLGQIPTRRDMLYFGFEELSRIVINLAQEDPALDPDLRPVSPEKIRFNRLSGSVEGFLKMGMERAQQVQRFFERWHDPTLGDRVAENFRQQYQKLRESAISPDMVFWELLAWAGGMQRRPPKEEAAIFAVLAYLFEQCDIFEPAEEEVS